MAVRTFQPYKNKQEVLQKMREGHTPEELQALYPVSLRTLFRYWKEVQDEAAGTPKPGKTGGNQAPGTTVVPVVSKHSSTTSGQVIPTPQAPGSDTGEFVRIAYLNMPIQDWGYSSFRNLLTVAATFDEAKIEYGFDKSVKVGDFLSYLCDAFRMMKGWDGIGAGYTGPQKKEGKHNGSGEE